jgi:hypothetical protein
MPEIVNAERSASTFMVDVTSETSGKSSILDNPKENLYCRSHADDMRAAAGE